MDDMSQIRRSQIIDAITQMLEVVLNDSVKFMKIDEFVIGLYKTEIEINPSSKYKISSYIIGDNRLFQDQIFTLLKRITNVFRTSYPMENIHQTINSREYESFGHEIDMILKDIQFTSMDRMRNGLS